RQLPCTPRRKHSVTSSEEETEAWGKYQNSVLSQTFIVAPNGKCYSLLFE
ncbi:hypothetical protein STEG23_013928, partial [Scotinomys teguina]